MMPPRICILTETYYPLTGGGESQARRLAEGLSDNGLPVFVLTRRSSASFKKKERVGPVAVYRLPPVGEQHFKKWGLLLTSFPKLFKLRRRYDLILVSGFRVIGISAVLISQLLKKACILKADSLGEMSGEFFAPGLARLHLNSLSFLLKAYLLIRNRILRCSTCFVAVSSAVRSELLSHGVDQNRISTIPNSVDIKIFRPVGEERKRELREELGIPLERKVVTFTGRLVSYKGLPLLMSVWKEIQRKHKDVCLLLVGSGGLDIHNCEGELRGFVKSNGLEGSVLFAGEVQNVHEFLQASDIFVFPTENEAFGISVIEAMAGGLPVIATCVGGIKDIIEHEKNGLVVMPGNFQQLYDALDLLISDSSLAVRLGMAGRLTARQRYSIQTVTRRYIELFEGAGIGPT